MEADTAEDVVKECGSPGLKPRESRSGVAPPYCRSVSDAAPDSLDRSARMAALEGGEKGEGSASAFQVLEEGGKGGGGGPADRYRSRAEDASPNVMVLRPSMSHHLFPYFCPPGMYSAASHSFPFPFNPLMLSSGASAMHPPPPLAMTSYLAGGGPDLSHLPPLSLPGAAAALGAGSLLSSGLFPSPHLFPHGLHSLGPAARPGRTGSPPASRGSGVPGRSATPPRGSSSSHALSACCPREGGKSPHGQHRGQGSLFPPPHKSQGLRYRPYHLPHPSSSSSSSSSAPRSPPSLPFPSPHSSSHPLSAPAPSSKVRGDVRSPELRSPGVLVPPSGPTVHAPGRPRSPAGGVAATARVAGGSGFRSSAPPRDAAVAQSADRTSHELQSMERMLTGLDRGGHVNREMNRRVSLT